MGLKTVLLTAFMLVGLSSHAQTEGEAAARIPYSLTDTWGSIRHTGDEAYTKQREEWKLSGKSGEDCVEGAPGKEATSLAAEFLSGDKGLREKEGGPTCRCIPMGESCRPQSCFCDEICPSHHGILRGRAGQLAPSMDNGLAFVNSADFNDTAFKRYPNVDGFCSGHNAVARKFQVLSDMRPELTSWAAMKKGSPEWRTYILGQIDRMGTEQVPEFLGITSIAELGADPEFKAALKKNVKVLEAENDEVVGDPKYWAGMVNQPKYSHPGITDIPAKVSVDPDTGMAVPQQGTKAYHDYIGEKVKKIAKGLPASLPGQASIYALSSDPAYMEIMGAQTAVDWRTFNSFEADEGDFAYSSGDDGEQPMSPAQLKTFITQAKENLPPYPDTYPKGKNPGERWNENGPFQTLPISLWATEKKGKTPDHGYHSIEAWAVRELPHGGLEVCIKDPNNEAGNDDFCANKLRIPNPNDPSKVTYAGFAERKIGKFNFTAYGLGHMGAMTKRLVAYCRRVKASSFRGGPCSE